ncbi:MAG: LTA synthase family protein [Acidobacteriota bacterium]|nr:LTA synthase family protein [Acidobacteriota bacterium]
MRLSVYKAGVRRPRTLGLLCSLVLLSFLTTPTGLADSQEPSARQPTTTYAFSIVGGNTPRLLFVAGDRDCEFEIRNDGYLAWDQSRKFSLSYHWLTVSGRDEVQEGLRSRLPGGVEPGETVELKARIKPPSQTGVYRLRWDMLEEGKGWFAQLTPRDPPPAPLIIVLPSFGFFLFFLLSVTVLVTTLLLLRKEHRTDRRTPLAGPIGGFLGVADLAWAALALYGKPYLLYAELPNRNLHAYSWTAVAAVGLLLVAAAILRGRQRPWACWAIVLIGTLDVLGQTLYFRFFDDVATTGTFFAAGQTGALGQSIAALSKPQDWLLAIDLLLALPVMRALGRRPGKRSRILPLLVLAATALPFIYLLGSAFLSRETSTRRNLKTLRTVSSHGMFGYQMLDVAARLGASLTRRPPEPDAVDEMVTWFQTTADERAAVGPWSGVAEGANLIAIQVESMQQFVLGLEVDGVEVTPNLNRLAESALRFDAVYDQTNRGRSSAGDFVAMTSILPVSESVAYEFWQNDYRALGEVLGESDYQTLSAIPYSGSFWNRHLTHGAYGFETNLFRDDFERQGLRIGWGLNDIEFLRQMTPKLRDLEEPFAAWLTTLSLHYPYESFPADLKVVRFGELERTQLGNYLQAMNLFDRALGEFFVELKQSGLAERTVVAVWGDHDAGLVRSRQFIEYFDLHQPAPKSILFGRVPFLIWAPGVEGEAFDSPSGQTDIVPTLLAVLGIDAAPLAYLGRNILTDRSDSPVVHSRGWAVSTDRFYLANQIELGKEACWSLPALEKLETSECSDLAQVSQRQIEISELLLEHDLQTEISSRLLALSDDTR